MILLTVLASVGASALIVAGVRVVQRLTGSSFQTVPVVVYLPRARDHPTRVVFALHATQLLAGRGQVRARTRGTGLLIATGSDGIAVGEAIVPRDRLLRPTTATVDFQTTAA